MNDEADGPIRTCIGCRTRNPGKTMVRVTVLDGEFTIGERGNGRGAWLCPTETCVESAARTKAFSRALRTKLADGVCAGTLLGWLGNRPYQPVAVGDETLRQRNASSRADASQHFDTTT